MRKSGVSRTLGSLGAEHRRSSTISGSGRSGATVGRGAALWNLVSNIMRSISPSSDYVDVVLRTSYPRSSAKKDTQDRVVLVGLAGLVGLLSLDGP